MIAYYSYLWPKPGCGWTLMTYRRGGKYVMRYFYPTQPEPPQ